jgi:hypothetical protein
MRFTRPYALFSTLLSNYQPTNKIGLTSKLPSIEISENLKNFAYASNRAYKNAKNDWIAYATSHIPAI